jgi:hypothetical protein
MKIVQTFWIDAGNNGLEASFGWCSAKYHLMSWTLSALQLNKFYSNVELITDTKGKELLIDQLKLPYQNVRVELDDLNFECSPQLWVTKKIYSYTLHDEPFLNVDGDVYIFNSFPNELLSGDLIAQNIEQDFDYYKELVGLVNQTFDYVPMPLKMQVEKSIPIQASNAGILGGKDHRFFKEYFQIVHNFVLKNKEKINLLTPSQLVNFNAVVEQYIFHCLSNDSNVAVKYLFDTVYDPSFFEGFCNFHYLPNKTPFIHALGDYKRNGWVCDQLANRLRMDYPEYYYDIINLIESTKKHIPETEFEESYSSGSSFSFNYLAKSEEKLFSRTKQIIHLICDREQISLDLSKYTIHQLKQYLSEELNNSSSSALLNDVFEFEKEKLRLAQSFPSDDFVLKNEAKANDNANHVFKRNNFQEKMELRLSPFCMIIESEWDWALNPTLFTRVKINNIEINFDQRPHYYQTLLLLDRHHGEVIEYLLGPVETYLMSLLSKEVNRSYQQLADQVILFFQNVEPIQVLTLLEESIRFLSYSGMIFVELNDS